jgi:hypothetical protein
VVLQHIALKRVHQLVTEHMIGFGQSRREGEDDAAGLVIGESADAVAEKRRRH